MHLTPQAGDESRGRERRPSTGSASGSQSQIKTDWRQSLRSSGTDRSRRPSRLSPGTGADSRRNSRSSSPQRAPPVPSALVGSASGAAWSDEVASSLNSPGSVADETGNTEPRIKVCVRVRPSLPEDGAGPDGAYRDGSIVAMPTRNIVQLTDPFLSSRKQSLHRPSELLRNGAAVREESPVPGQRSFEFDRCYWSHSESHSFYDTQATLHAELGDPIVVQAARGYNNCVFAYGQTGSGKSYSLIGGKDRDRGLLPRIVEDLFLHFETLGKDKRCRTLVSFLEIYNEHLRDLLAPRSDARLEVKNHPVLGTFVPKLTEAAVTVCKDVLDLVEYGCSVRHVSATAMNKCSSRSHCIFMLKTSVVTANEQALRSQTNIVDLAGSERVARTQATGERLVEGASINRSLTTLSRVISALVAKGGGQKPPFRDSKLTHLLKQSLSGNSKTVMLAAISPAADDYEETHSTLKFATSVKEVNTYAVCNKDADSALCDQLKREIESLREQLAEYQAAKGSDAAKISELRRRLEEQEQLYMAWNSGHDGLPESNCIVVPGIDLVDAESPTTPSRRLISGSILMDSARSSSSSSTRHKHCEESESVFSGEPPSSVTSPMVAAGFGNNRGRRSRGVDDSDAPSSAFNDWTLGHQQRWPVDEESARALRTGSGRWRNGRRLGSASPSPSPSPSPSVALETPPDSGAALARQLQRMMAERQVRSEQGSGSGSRNASSGSIDKGYGTACSPEFPPNSAASSGRCSTHEIMETDGAEAMCSPLELLSPPLEGRCGGDAAGYTPWDEDGEREVSSVDKLPIVAGMDGGNEVLLLELRSPVAAAMVKAMGGREGAVRQAQHQMKKFQQLQADVAETQKVVRALSADPDLVPDLRAMVVLDLFSGEAPLAEFIVRASRWTPFEEPVTATAGETGAPPSPGSNKYDSPEVEWLSDDALRQRLEWLHRGRLGTVASSPDAWADAIAATSQASSSSATIAQASNSSAAAAQVFSRENRVLAENQELRRQLQESKRAADDLQQQLCFCQQQLELTRASAALAGTAGPEREALPLSRFGSVAPTALSVPRVAHGGSAPNLVSAIAAGFDDAIQALDVAHTSLEVEGPRARGKRSFRRRHSAYN